MQDLKVSEAISIDRPEVEDMNYFIYFGTTVHEAHGLQKDTTRRAVVRKKVVCHC